MFIGIHDFRGIRIKMIELGLDKASKDCFTLYTIAEMISMAETGTRTITLTKGLGCLMK